MQVSPGKPASIRGWLEQNLDLVYCGGPPRLAPAPKKLRELEKRIADGERVSSARERLIPWMRYRRPRVKNTLATSRLRPGHSAPVISLNQVRAVSAAPRWPTTRPLRQSI